MYVVVTKTHFEPDARAEVLALLKAAAPVFRKQPGFVSFLPHEAQDGGHTLGLLVWQTQSAHEACMASPDWADLSAAWEELQAAGKIRFELEAYAPIAA